MNQNETWLSSRAFNMSTQFAFDRRRLLHAAATGSATTLVSNDAIAAEPGRVKRTISIKTSANTSLAGLKQIIESECGRIVDFTKTVKRYGEPTAAWWIEGIKFLFFGCIDGSGHSRRLTGDPSWRAFHARKPHPAAG